ncbi:hypothetical protein MSPP1_004045 [Malassezia sp. CBS 17886]|nr:hypothetical protein MSPP1_004045 [Malassezia sp. CBS 17886]
MQLIVDKRLVQDDGWGIGPMMAQAAHATTAVLVQTSGRPDTQAYTALENLVHMHKIVLQTPKGVSLAALSARLQEAAGSGEDADGGTAGGKGAEEENAGGSCTGTLGGPPHEPTIGTSAPDADATSFPPHCLWIEQPENTPTCVAIAPNRKPDALKRVLKKCTLLRM